MTTPTRSRLFLVALAPQLNLCPKCGAGRGAWCISRGGYQNSAVGFHAARRALVADLPEDEAYAQVTALLDEQERRQAEARAQLAQPLTPEQVATRKAVSDAFDQMNAQLRAEERDLRARCTDTPFYGMRSHADDCQCRTGGEVRWQRQVVEARRVEALRGTLPVADLSVERARRRVVTPFRRPGGAA